jgi:transmembrane sensor
MKKKKNIEQFSDKDWEAMASILSGEISDTSIESDLSFSDDKLRTEKYWKEIGKMNDNDKINVDNAWSKLHSRIKEETVVENNFVTARPYSFQSFLKIAAVIILIAGLGLAGLYLNNSGVLSKRITAETGSEQKNIEVILPDGSKVVMNHNTRLSYLKNFGKGGRMVKLAGEALFDITPDNQNPFIIDAGKARIKVVGTTFNVITSNNTNAVEVFVKSGKVLLTDSLEKQNLTLEPGYLGIMDSKTSEKYINNDQNYLAWNTNRLVFDGQKLKDIFNDVKKVYNIDIVADPEILDKTFTTTFDNETEETVITLICRAFSLDFRKDGNIYYLSEK